MISYLDTNAAAWLATGRLHEFSKEAERVIQTAELLLSPMVLLELEYLHDLGRSRLRSRVIQRKLQGELPIQVCELSFEIIAEVAVGEGWTKDPFDRIIVANARANSFALLISADKKVAQHYPKTI